VIIEALLERTIRTVMLWAARVSAALLLTGLIWWLVQPHAELALRVLDAGILLLMAVPMLRVLQSAARATWQRDWLHVGTIVAVGLLLAATLWYAGTRT
jgi:uncharacterized membrane protein